MTKPASVSVVVPVGGAAPAWPRCAAALERLDPPPDEIVVVFDGVGDGLSEGARHFLDGHRWDEARKAVPTGTTLLELDRQGGPARARNRGVERASSDVLFFLDSDVEAPTNLVGRVREIFASDDALTAIIGSYDDAPGDPHFVAQYRNLLHHYVHQTSHEQASTFWSGCGAVRREAFDEAGGFDEDAYADPSIEDIELGARLLNAGHQVRLVKDLQVKHLKRWTFWGMVHTDLFKRAIPWTEQMLATGGLVNDLNVKTKDRISVVLAFLLPAALLSAIWWLPALWIGLAAGVGILGLNAGLFGFFLRRRGVLFALGAVPLYWVYLVICGVGFGVGWARHLLLHRRR